jgi:hypothetical protein
MSPAFRADAVLTAHFLFVSFVLFGQVAILIGIAARWGWIRNPWFRVIHLLAILYIVGQAALGITCPLTLWEAHYRAKAGQFDGKPDHWIGRGMSDLLFYEGEPWAFLAGYATFALLVVLAFWLAPPCWRKPKAGPKVAALPGAETSPAA